MVSNSLDFTSIVRSAESLANRQDLNNPLLFVSLDKISGFSCTFDSSIQLKHKALTEYLLFIANNFKLLIAGANGAFPNPKIPKFQKRCIVLLKASHNACEISRFSKALKIILENSPQICDFSLSQTEKIRDLVNCFEKGLLDRIKLICIRSHLKERYVGKPADSEGETITKEIISGLANPVLMRLDVLLNKQCCTKEGSEKYQKFEMLIKKAIKENIPGQKRPLSISNTVVVVTHGNYGLPLNDKWGRPENNPQNKTVKTQLNELKILPSTPLLEDEKEIEAFKIQMRIQRKLEDLHGFFREELLEQFSTRNLDKSYDQDYWAVNNLFQEITTDLIYQLETQNASDDPNAAPQIAVAEELKRLFSYGLFRKFEREEESNGPSLPTGELTEPYVKKEIELLMVELLNLDSKHDNNIVDIIVYYFEND
ncbi:MAG: hypothetical protein WC222_06705 [Parachlamydiales bacterium]|jgi:hypothetical protein